MKNPGHFWVEINRLGNRRPCHFFPRASFNKSACMRWSAYIRLSPRFSSSMVFIWLITDASMPPYFARHL